MPYVEVKAFEDRFTADPGLAERVIAAVTDAIAQTLGEETREKTSVVITGVPRTRWGFGGKLRP
jgi:phenylpyruvate tautomerase PptA (4-oxalocrotonate tautomerase family)